MMRIPFLISIGLGSLAVAACQRVSAPPENQAAATGEAAATNQAAVAGNAGSAATAAPAGPADPATSEKPLARAASAAELSWGPCPPGMPQGCQIAVLHGDPAKPDSDIFLRVPGGAAIDPHWHSSAERMMLATGRLEVKYQGASPAVLEPGTYAYGPAGLPHRADCRSSGPCTLFIAFDGPVDRHPYEGAL